MSAAKHRSSRSRRRRCAGRKGARRQRKKDMILAAAALVLALAIVLIGRNLYFFATGNDVTDEEPYPVRGVDVSSYQLDIDWEGLEDEGYKFAFIKATEGSSHVDSMFEYNWDEVNKTGIRAGAYHFLSYDTSGRRQAANFIEHVDKKWGMLPPVVDVEFYGEYIEKPPKASKLRKVLNRVLAELEDHYGMRPIIYTNSHIYSTYISGHYDDYDVWISAHEIPEELGDGKQWTFCQYSFRGRSDSVAGGEKYVDLNVFNGSSWEFRKYN